MACAAIFSRNYVYLYSNKLSMKVQTRSLVSLLARSIRVADVKTNPTSFQ